MKAMCLEGSAQDRALVEKEVPIPAPGAGEILVQIHAAGVTPTEMQWYPTTHTLAGGVRKHAVPGHEFSGVIKACGEGVTGFHEGQEVYGMNDWFAEGATAEYCITVPASIAAKPATLSHAEAASVPISALTAWQGLLERAKVTSGERVLVHGGSGAVGIFAIQLAKRAGAQVITTASSRNRDFLTQLGADQVIDYKTERFNEVLRDIDVIFDGVGGDTLQRSWPVLKPGGRLVTIAADSEVQQDERTKAAFFIVTPNHVQLTEIASRLDAGKLRAFVDGIVPLSEASEAYFGGVKSRAGRGKLVISIL